MLRGVGFEHDEEMNGILYEVTSVGITNKIKFICLRDFDTS
jgi:hypothetical protein